MHPDSFLYSFNKKRGCEDMTRRQGVSGMEFSPFSDQSFKHICMQEEINLWRKNYMKPTWKLRSQRTPEKWNQKQF